MELQELIRLSAPFTRTIQRCVRSNAAFHFTLDDGRLFAVMIFPENGFVYREAVPQFRMPDEHIGLSFRELIETRERYANHYGKPIDLDETLRLFSAHTALLRTCAAGASRQAAAEIQEHNTANLSVEGQ